jgi:hypothetical protein
MGPKEEPLVYEIEVFRLEDGLNFQETIDINISPISSVVAECRYLEHLSELNQMAKYLNPVLSAMTDWQSFMSKLTDFNHNHELNKKAFNDCIERFKLNESQARAISRTVSFIEPITLFQGPPG